MKAVCLMAPFDVQIREIPDPERSQGQALLKILSAGICGSDVNAYRAAAKNSVIRPSSAMRSLPRFWKRTRDVASQKATAS